MIDDVASSLLALLRSSIPETEAAVRFEPPTPGWAATLNGPCIDLFLHDVVEDMEARSGDWTDVRDGEGRVVARQPPLRHYRLSYLVSAWGPSAEAEHRLLGRVLRTVAEADTIPAALLTGSLLEAGAPVQVALAQPGPSRLRPHELWSALSSPPRPSFELVVNAPVRPAPITDVAAAPETVSLGVSRQRRPHSGGGLAPCPPPESAPEPEERAEKRWTAFRPREPKDRG